MTRAFTVGRAEDPEEEESLCTYTTVELPEGAENGPNLSSGIINLVVLLGGLACGYRERFEVDFECVPSLLALGFKCVG